MSAELLERLDRAFKEITDISTLDEAILQPAKFNQFIHEMQHRTTVLPDARFISMDSHQVDIDRIGFVGRILKSGSADDGSSRTLSSNEFAKPTTQTNQLNASELQAIASLRDRALRRNIERGGFENTLIDLFGQAAGRDFEEFALLADSSLDHNDDDVLSKSDGWAKLSEQKLYGRSWDTGVDTGDFDISADDYPVNLLQAMLEALPKQFLVNPAEWRFYVPWEIRDGYHNLLKERTTGLGDAAMQDALSLRYKGIPVVYVPMLERSPSVDLTDETEVTRDRVEGRIAKLDHPDNLAWGVFHEVTVEREREAKERRTDFVLTIEADMHYEDENASVTAFLDKAEPTS